MNEKCIYLYTVWRGNVIELNELEEYVDFEMSNKELTAQCKLFSETKNENIWWERGTVSTRCYVNAECFCLND